ncbi:MAG: DUF1501 domain-containing protein [Planctomycetes bacterium]|nr:DUF1501 domain-containing protein [Planctomycetota bacterium]
MTLHKDRLNVSRRDCLKLGLGALLGGGLVDMFRLRAHATGASPAVARSCILIWMDGGPTHYETFDPKPNAPSEIRGAFQPIQTRTTGVQVSQHMQRLASISDKYAIVRSIRHDQGNHGAGNHYMMTGAPPRIPVGCGAFVSFHPSMGSVTAHERSAPNGLPSYFSMPSMSRSGGPNFLGARFAPFIVDDNPNSPDFRVRDVALPRGLSEGRFDSRRQVRREVDRLERILDREAGDPVNALDEHYQQGYNLVRSREAQAAFDISGEPERVRDAYGRNPMGQRALLARRLVEAGVPFITLYDGGWDHHTNLFNSLAQRLPAWDATVATLIQDLDQRGMLASTMVIALGEFGRTPTVNRDAGRDHWSNSMSVLFAGAGTPGGQAVGATDVRGYAPVGHANSPENFVSTIYLKLGIDPGKILFTPQGRPTHLVSETEPIRELMG